MITTEQKQLLLARIKSGKYTVDVEMPDGFELCENYRGEKFVGISGNEEEEEAENFDAGSCWVNVDEWCFECALNTGEWSYNEQEPLEDKELIALLEHAKGVFHGAHSSVDSIRELFCAENHLPTDLTYSWLGSDNCLKDVRLLGRGEAYVPLVYTETNWDNWLEDSPSINDGGLYDLYLFLRKAGRLPEPGEEVRISDWEVKKVAPDLYNDLIDQLSIDIEVIENLKFSLRLTSDVFEIGLHRQADCMKLVFPCGEFWK